jgi:hypothetical protein
MEVRGEKSLSATLSRKTILLRQKLRRTYNSISQENPLSLKSYGAAGHSGRKTTYQLTVQSSPVKFATHQFLELFIWASKVQGLWLKTLKLRKIS